MVRAEIDRVSTDADSFRAYYLAEGAIDRALLWIEWDSSGRHSKNVGTLDVQHVSRMRFDFPSGDAFVELIPESAKLDINHATVQDLFALMMAAGAPPEQARSIATAIEDWRTPQPAGTISAIDQGYLTGPQSFRPDHASFEEIEELLLVRGMTPELFYGGYRKTPDGQLMPYGGVRDCVSVFGSVNAFDVNTVSPTLLRAIGVRPDVAQGIVNLRNTRPIVSLDQLGSLASSGPAMARLSVSGGTVYTLRATARLRYDNGQFSEVKRTVAEMVQFFPIGKADPPYHVLRWYDEAPPAPAAAPPGPGQVTVLE